LAFAPETVMTEEPLPTVPVTLVGALAAPAEVTAEDAPLEVELPIALVATAVNV
jgi:hypothetical protein